MTGIDIERVKERAREIRESCVRISWPRQLAKLPPVMQNALKDYETWE